MRHVANVIAKKTNETNHIKLGFLINSIMLDTINLQDKNYQLNSLLKELVQS